MLLFFLYEPLFGIDIVLQLFTEEIIIIALKDPIM
jgi:hypothetical protein